MKSARQRAAPLPFPPLPCQYRNLISAVPWATLTPFSLSPSILLVQWILLISPPRPFQPSYSVCPLKVKPLPAGPPPGRGSANRLRAPLRGRVLAPSPPYVIRGKPHIPGPSAEQKCPAVRGRPRGSPTGVAAGSARAGKFRTLLVPFLNKSRLFP